MSVARRSSISPPRIPWKSMSSTQKYTQNVTIEGSPVRGRKPFRGSGISVIHEIHIQNAPRSPVTVNVQSYECSYPDGFSAEFNDGGSSNPYWPLSGEEYNSAKDEVWNRTRLSLPPPSRLYHSPQHHQRSFSEDISMPRRYPDTRRITDPKLEVNMAANRRLSPTTNWDIHNDTHNTDEHNGVIAEISTAERVQPLQYHHISDYANNLSVRSISESRGPNPKSKHRNPRTENSLNPLGEARQRSGNPRPVSSHSEMWLRGRSPAGLGLGYIPPPSPGLRVSSAHSRRPGQLDRSTSSPNISLGESNLALRPAVGANASLLSTTQTLEMYRQNVSKTNDPGIQYDFAMVLIEAAQEAGISHTQNSSSESLSKRSDAGGQGGVRDPENPDSTQTPAIELLGQAKKILKKLADRSYPYAQYYLADGYTSGLFAKGKPDNEKAFPLFIAASKHGHAESGYRAALCYEYGWGCKKDHAKAIQYYLQSASKSHPGAMTRLGKGCISGELGRKKYREGLKWLRRAQESADIQYNTAPYILGCMYEKGYGDDIFMDEAYSARLFTQAADLGHVEAAYRLGEAYELGKLGCPKDPALSLHFYNMAAQGNHSKAMMGLCAWYLVGAERLLEIDHDEAFEWAMKAAKQKYAAAEYAVGCFKEMGMGCRCDAIEANVWFVRAADHGEPRAQVRLRTINSAAEGEGIGVGRNKGKGKSLAPAISSPSLESNHSESSIQAGGGKRNSSNTNSNRSGSRPTSKQNDFLQVPARHSRRKSRSPHVVTSGGPRFSLGESPQKPKRNVLRKHPVEGDVIIGNEGEEMIIINGVGDAREKRSVSRDKEKKKANGWFSGLWK